MLKKPECCLAIDLFLSEFKVIIVYINTTWFLNVTGENKTFLAMIKRNSAMEKYLILALKK